MVDNPALNSQENLYVYSLYDKGKDPVATKQQQSIPVDEVWKLSLNPSETHAAAGYFNRSPYSKGRYLDDV
jgi:hypothetical protein